jgi:hypothetical protein
MMDEIRLSTGQPAQLRDGIVHVATPPPHHYRLMVHHHGRAATCEARAQRYEQLVALTKQFEALDYRLVRLEQVPGALP